MVGWLSYNIAPMYTASSSYRIFTSVLSSCASRFPLSGENVKKSLAGKVFDQSSSSSSPSIDSTEVFFSAFMLFLTFFVGNVDCPNKIFENKSNKTQKT